MTRVRSAVCLRAVETQRVDRVDIAERWAAEEVSLPMHPHLNEDEIEYVAHVLNWAISAPRG
jgi:dTDP-4-amino-4,6-dideoxygalactose transaminase